MSELLSVLDSALGNDAPLPASFIESSELPYAQAINYLLAVGYSSQAIREIVGAYEFAPEAYPSPSALARSTALRMEEEIKFASNWQQASSPSEADVIPLRRLKMERPVGEIAIWNQQPA